MLERSRVSLPPKGAVLAVSQGDREVEYAIESTATVGWCPTCEAGGLGFRRGLVRGDGRSIPTASKGWLQSGATPTARVSVVATTSVIASMTGAADPAMTPADVVNAFRSSGAFATSFWKICLRIGYRSTPSGAGTKSYVTV